MTHGPGLPLDKYVIPGTVSKEVKDGRSMVGNRG